ncbi:MAG: ABC transporter permease YtrF [Verrucomicrobia subdivision 3 bacterium]|nr:ABC transporter permease YtrF [Limisphaerales bacterium]MCS1416105.1 ABC transporter permease YtrF [Limisphaerales bacterium]
MNPSTLLPRIVTIIRGTAMPTFRSMACARSSSFSTPRTPQRFSATLVIAFGIVALGLALIGIFGVISNSVAQRHYEFGIRMALGAQRRNILDGVPKQGVILGMFGVAIGLLISPTVAHLIASQLYAISPTDPLTYLTVIAAIIGAVIPACLLPAKRATETNLIQAL